MALLAFYSWETDDSSWSRRPMPAGVLAALAPAAAAGRRRNGHPAVAQGRWPPATTARA
jgi:hypothetical protein